MLLAPVPEEDEAVDVVATMGAVLRTVGDGLANLAGFGGVAGGVEVVFGLRDVVLAFGFVVTFAFSPLGFFAVAGEGFCFVIFKI